MSTIGGAITLLISGNLRRSGEAMSDDRQDPSAVDPAERKGRFEIRLMLALVALILLGGALWVAVNGSPTADRRALDSSDAPLPPPAAAAR